MSAVRTEEAVAEAAVVKADCPSVSADFILDRSLPQFIVAAKMLRVCLNP
jgi:hypothetical protein